MTLSRAIQELCDAFCGHQNAEQDIHDDACTVIRQAIFGVEALAEALEASGVPSGRFIATDLRGVLEGGER